MQRSVIVLAVGVLVALVVSVLTALVVNSTALAGGGGPISGTDKTVFDCPRPNGMGHSEILVGYYYMTARGTPIWYRYCVYPTVYKGKAIYARETSSFWPADTRENGYGQTTPFYEGEIVLLEDRNTIAIYGNYWEEKIHISGGPCFFMRAKSSGVVTGKATINPPFWKLSYGDTKIPYCANQKVPPPATFVLPTNPWFDLEQASKKESCWEWEGTALIFPECIKLPEEGEKLHTTVKAPYAPIPPTPKGEFVLKEVLEWCVGGYCQDPQRFTYLEENGQIVKTSVRITAGTGLVMSLPPKVWATYSLGRDMNGNKIEWTAYGPRVIYIEEGVINLN